MSKKWNFATAPAIAVLTAWATFAGGCTTPQADALPVLDSAAAPAGASGAGNFPRSLLIPGTSTSVRIGGSISQSVYTR